MKASGGMMAKGGLVHNGNLVIRRGRSGRDSEEPACCAGGGAGNPGPFRTLAFFRIFFLTQLRQVSYFGYDRCLGDGGKGIMGKQHAPDLSKVEWELMKVIWRLESARVSDVYEAFLHDRGWSHNTIKTMMQRLVKKGYLRCDDSQRAHVYDPAISRDRAVHRTLWETLDRILEDSFGPLVVYAAQRRNLSDEEGRKLREILKGDNRDA